MVAIIRVAACRRVSIINCVSRYLRNGDQRSEHERTVMLGKVASP